MDISPVTPSGTRIGWIGTGVMGGPMCTNLMRAGYSMTVTTRTREKADALIADGAIWAESPRELAEGSDIIFSIVGFPRDVREVILGSDGALAGSRPGTVIVDMTTSEPSLAIEIAETAAERDVVSLDAPVSGGQSGAIEARLSIMVGGDRAGFDALEPCFEVLGKTIEYQGGPGCGQHTKLVNQTLIASNMIGVCEALLYASRAGLDIEAVLRSVSTGAAGSWSLSNLGPKIVARDFEPGFYVEHFIKDMEIALREAERMKLQLPGLDLAHGLYTTLAEMGHARRGTQALQLALAKLSHVEWN